MSQDRNTLLQNDCRLSLDPLARLADYSSDTKTLLFRLLVVRSLLLAAPLCCHTLRDDLCFHFVISKFSEQLEEI